jgi:hypothetical protein
MWVKTPRNEQEEAAEPKYEYKEEDSCGAPANMKMRTNSQIKMNMEMKLNMNMNVNIPMKTNMTLQMGMRCC